MRRLLALSPWVFAAVGAVAIAALVEGAGAPAVLRVLAGAAPWLPVLLALEIAIAAADVVSLRSLYGEAAALAKGEVWLRTAMIAYAASVLVPAGRVAGEVARAAELAPHVGAPRAIAGASVLQGSFLWATALIAIPCGVAVALASGATSTLSLLVLGTALFHVALGSLLALGPRAGRLPSGRRATQWHAMIGLGAAGTTAANVARAARAMPAFPVVPTSAALIGRALQVVQCGVLLVAVGGSFDLAGALWAEAIQVVAANAGDAIPGQAGVTEAAYRMFGAPGMSAAAHALAIALLLRVCRTLLAATSALACMVWRPRAAMASA